MRKENTKTPHAIQIVAARLGATVDAGQHAGKSLFMIRSRSSQRAVVLLS